MLVNTLCPASQETLAGMVKFVEIFNKCCVFSQIKNTAFNFRFSTQQWIFFVVAVAGKLSTTG
jgi:hypothetical protein